MFAKVRLRFVLAYLVQLPSVLKKVILALPLARSCVT
jgi:hypothetical protein